MGKIFWLNIHTIIFLLLVIGKFIEEVGQGGKEIYEQLKLADNSKKRSLAESIMMIIIMLGVVVATIALISWGIRRNQIVTAWMVGIIGIIYVYIAIKQIIKMIFIPDNRAFSDSDIAAFTITYIIWWIMLVGLNSLKIEGDIFGRTSSNLVDVVNVVGFFLWYYFNILFVLSGTYIILYYVWKFVIKQTEQFKLIIEMDKFIEAVYNWRQQGEKFAGLRSYNLWKDGRKNNIIYSVFMTIPLLICDICQITLILMKVTIKAMIATFIIAICNPVRSVYKCIKQLWNKHNNNEWLYIFAQIAGLCSYAITFITVQYGDYEEATKNIYEFIGTIILIPYFLAKIVGVRKALKENVPQIIHKEKKYSNANNMTYNEDAEEIDGKTIRQSECETVQGMEKNFHRVNIIDNWKIEKDFRRMIRNNRRTKIKIFLENNVEIVVGICISVFMVGIYFVFKSPQNAKNISLIGSIVGAEGTMVAVLLTIAFTKKSNERALDATVLPYLTIEKDNKPSENAYAFEYFKTTIDKRDFSVWRKFNFDMICRDKEKLTRNGIAYLHIKNVGIGPAIYLNMEIENFSNVYLPIDYLRPNEDLHLILNFNNPDDSYQTNIIFEYETIRGNRHSQRFQANITRHLDRTNFTLFG